MNHTVLVAALTMVPGKSVGKRVLFTLTVLSE
jgi:hypothetical protein